MRNNRMNRHAIRSCVRFDDFHRRLSVARLFSEIHARLGADPAVFSTRRHFRRTCQLRWPAGAFFMDNPSNRCVFLEILW